MTLPEETTFTSGDGQVIRLYTNDGAVWMTSGNVGAEAADIAILSGSTNSQYKVGDGEIDVLNGYEKVILASGTTAEEEGSAAAPYSGANLYLNAGGTITAAIYAGSTGNQNDETITFYNDKATKLVLAGDITLVADSKFKVDANTAGSGPYIEGAISGAGKTLELSGTQTMRMSGGATLKTLAGSASVLMDDKKADGTSDAAGKIYTFTNATGNGALTIDTDVTLNLLGHATDAALQTTSKAIENSGTIFIGDTSSSKNTVTLKGNVTGNGYIKLHSDTNLRIESTVSQNFDMDGSGNACNAKLIVGGTGVVTVKNDVWMDAKANTAIEIETKGELKRGTWTYTNANTQNAVLRRTEVNVTGGKAWSATSDQFTVTGAKLILNDSAWNQVGNQLVNCSLVNSGSGEMRVYSAIGDNKLAALDVQNGSVSFRNRTDEVKIDALTLTGGRNVGFYSDDSTNITKITALQVTDSLTMTGGTSGTITASMLTLADGVTLDFSSSVTLVGALTLNSNLVLADGMLGEKDLILFTGATGLTLSSGTYTAPVDAASVFSGIEAGTYNLVYSDNVVSIRAIPEPTTATLSLLALAGLAARRRRK